MLSRLALGIALPGFRRLPIPAAIFGALLLLIPAPGRANDRYAAIVADITSGRVLHSEAAGEPRYPASLTKMMTLYLLFEDLERGRLALNSALAVSSNAETQAPSKLGLKAGETIEVEDAIKALVTKSANDVAVTVAENLAGSELAFANRMTRTAYDLGMTSTRFRNASGLPDPDQVTTARDMMVLGAALQARFPRYYAYFKTRAFAFRGRIYKSHNRLVGKIEGIDGIKTGYIRASGFNLVSSVQRDGRRIVAVVMGGVTAKSRDQQMEALIVANLPMAQAGRGNTSEVAAVAVARPVVVASAGAEALVSTSSKPLKQVRVPVAAAAVAEKAAGYVIQIGALPSREAAMKILTDTQAKHGDILEGLEPVAQGYKSVVRARYSGFADRQTAAGVCELLRKKGVSCQVLPP
jgi:D-alanyl-D-alanine carboxypeptidase